MLASVKAQFPRQGPNRDRKYARFRLEDFDGTLDGVAFSEAYERHRDDLAPDRIVFLEGTLATDREEPSLRVDRVVPVERAFEDLVSSVVVAAGARGEESAGAFRSLRTALESHPGAVPVFLDLEPRPGMEAVFRVEGMAVRPGPEFRDAVEKVFGAGCLRLGRAPVAPAPRRAWAG
jgi:DNA polymerase III alpha subunit